MSGLILMPELPDIEVYLSCLRPRIGGHSLQRLRLISPFVLRSVESPVEAVEGLAVERLSRLGKRVVLEMDDQLFIVIHLMVAGRFRWAKPGARPPGKIALAAFEFETGTLFLTEAGGKKRAALHIVTGRAALAEHDPGGIEPLTSTPDEFRNALTRENRTLKRALTSPRDIAGIGNAYSDEILHAANLSPAKLTSKLTESELDRLFNATQRTLTQWTDRLKSEFATKFPGPGDITAFRPDFAVHGRFGRPCPVCGANVQRIVRADNEINYCPTCQTGGKLLRDRSLSRLLKDDWPETVDG
jgi:formamidopyrimidine-DNA glycosylase